MQLADSLCSEGYDGPIVLIGEDPDRPYQKPPLSKELAEDGGFDLKGHSLRLTVA